MITTVKSNGPLHALSIYTGFIYIAFTLWMAVAVFYVMYVIGDPEFIPTFFIIQTIANIFSLALANKLMLSLGKKKTALYSLPVGIAIAIFQYFVPADNVTLLMSCIFIFIAVLGINMGVMWTMAADTVEYSEWKTGLRAEGAVYGYYNFTTKIAMAIGGGLSGFILGAYGYDAELVTPQALEGIAICMTIVPAILFTLAFISVRFYNIDEQQYNHMVDEIEQRKLATSGV